MIDKREGKPEIGFCQFFDNSQLCGKCLPLPAKFDWQLNGGKASRASFLKRRLRIELASLPSFGPRPYDLTCEPSRHVDERQLGGTERGIEFPNYLVELVSHVCRRR
jgi:hypothetical protein